MQPCCIASLHGWPQLACNQYCHALQSFADALIDIIEDVREEGEERDNVAKVLETANKVGKPRRRWKKGGRTDARGATSATMHE